jgi:hypothetical protein
MESKELRQVVVDKFNAKALEFGQLKSAVEAFCVGILVDLKDVLCELPDAKTVVNIAIDEADERTSTGPFDPIDGPLAKGIAGKLIDAFPQVEKWFVNAKTRALQIINSQIPQAPKE